MRAFGEEVDHLQNHFPADADDTEWLEFIGKNDFYLITRDERIRKRPAELTAFKEHGVGAFFLGDRCAYCAPNRDLWAFWLSIARWKAACLS